ncbi:hypothetical protein [Catellatospora sp. NPDC049609]
MNKIIFGVEFCSASRDELRRYLLGLPGGGELEWQMLRCAP